MFYAGNYLYFSPLWIIFDTQNNVRSDSERSESEGRALLARDREPFARELGYKKKKNWIKKKLPRRQEKKVNFFQKPQKRSFLFSQVETQLLGLLLLNKKQQKDKLN